MSSVVLLTGDAPQHQFVSAALREGLKGQLAAVIVESRDAESLRSRFKRHVRRYTLGQLLSRVHWHLWWKATGRAKRYRQKVSRTLYPDGLPEPLPSDLLHTVPDHNGPECLKLLQDLQPRVLAVYGTGLIRPHVAGLAKEVALNLHTGVSPRYRGSGSVFWAIHNEEPEWVGSTVHVLASDVDAGDILAVVRPQISPDDDVASLFAKCVQVGAKAYSDQILAVLDGTATMTPQDLSSGRQYRFVDQTVRAERRVKRLIEKGLIRRYARGA